MMSQLQCVYKVFAHIFNSSQLSLDTGILTLASVAQSNARLTLDHAVAGSIPFSGIFFLGE